MKVLWFTNTPGLGAGYMNMKVVVGGWIKSLESEIKHDNDINLALAFISNNQFENFSYNNTDYYPINPHNTLFDKVRNKLTLKRDVNKIINSCLKIIEDYKPDIIHVHGTEFPFGLVQKYTKVPVVVSIQGILTVYAQKFFSGISEKDVQSYDSLSSKIFQTSFAQGYSRFKYGSMIEAEIFKLTNNIIGRTAWDYRVTSILSNNAKYFHVDEILREIFYINKWDKSRGDLFKIFTINGNNLYKGIETIMYAAKLLDDKKILYEWRIAGLAENMTIVNLALKSLRIKLSKNITFLGMLSEDRLVEELLSSDTYVMPSHIENSPNNLCEAMILGLPCVATYAGGTGSLISDREDGLVIQDGDPFAMAGSIIELKRNPSQAKLYGEKARIRALLRHDKKAIKKQIVNVYKIILNE